MLALVKYAAGSGNMELRDIPEPSPAAGEVKIEVKAASICGSDLHIRRGDIGIPMKYPVVPGHEFSGIVTETGQGVERDLIGARVTGENTRFACGKCRCCAAGSYNLCKERLATGYAFDGAFTRYVIIPIARIHRLPPEVDFASGALTDPSACAYHAVQELTRINAGDFVLVTGPGPMGLFCLQYAKANGAKVILTGRANDARRLELGRRLGADFVCAADQAEAEIMKSSNGNGVDAAIECSGAEAAASLCLKTLRREGIFTLVGIGGRPVQFDLDRILYKELRVAGSFSQKYSGWEKALEFCAAGLIKVKPLITHVFPLAEWQKAFDLFEKGEGIKVVFEMK
ncbi:MAG: alcohol dehydrogenase catalytic domain-containing protein [Kiritimatiellae bacterium]|nr:alcohol dehydrogenase catalytic domain-containing protein [Kiritimatiellia bacterium]